MLPPLSIETIGSWVESEDLLDMVEAFALGLIGLNIFMALPLFLDFFLVEYLLSLYHFVFAKSIISRRELLQEEKIEPASFRNENWRGFGPGCGT